MKSYSKSIKIWLIAGIVLLFFQVIIGGVTRITGSGLSITKWEIITGTLPPMNSADWNSAFDLYKETPQYKKLNHGMDLSDFKFIYFWEYFHRLWARAIGFVFIIPFFFFLSKGYIDRILCKRLLVVVILAAVTASFGWIMVASGLIERPWVNAYKLSLHLSLALITLGYLVWTTADVFLQGSKMSKLFLYRRFFYVFFIFLCVQLFLGGMMSGMRAGLLFPTWPDMNGSFFPNVLLVGDNWKWDNFVHYDRSVFMGALVQFLHRLIAYVLFFFGGFLFYRMYIAGIKFLKRFSVYFIFLLLLQVFIGILTVIHSKGNVPIFFGVIHQAVAILLLLTSIIILYLIRKPLVK